ncbi:MAG: tripartite tricarboxylate transporter substrate binding protein [Actinobacteria bacterium]|nr:tripartite tricarboxylate transporter substrate binding protein [Actinomycetota bacterium]MSX58139.1 tripartite tricarboxylate transporter substrate binding protein [Actinomycetota bacterium]
MEKSMKIIVRAGAALAVAALLASSAGVSQAAVKPAVKANIGDDCTAASVGKTAAGRGVDGTDLTCLVVQTGSYKGTNKWWYKDVKALKNIDWTVPANPGGYSLTSNAISDTLKAEGLLSEYTSTFKPGAGGSVGLGAFQEIKGKPEAALVVGIALTGGMYSNKSPLNLLSSTPIAKVLREYDAIVVPASSKYRTLTQLMDDLKAKPNGVAIAGGSKGGIDHQVIGLLAQKAGIDPTKLNYVVFSGGPEVITSVLSNSTQVGISGSSEFAAFVASGKLRVLGVSSAKSLTGFKGKTFVSQGYDLVYGNWRGIMAPADISAADRLNFIKVIDIMHISPSWKAQLVKNNWDNEFAAGSAFKAFLEKHIPEINAVMKGLGI